MRTIGLIAGMSWESALHYCRLINEGVKANPGAGYGELMSRLMPMPPEPQATSG
jgi:aspartate/glutamate racemase